MSSSVLITGASGFISRHLARTLKSSGYHTVGISRSATSLEGFDRVFPAALGTSLEPLLSEEHFDAVVHCANSTGPRELETNVAGTELWRKEAAAHRVGVQIFLSSVSAKDDALSDYGAAKFALEEKFLAANQVVFRLGLVIGNGGMFERIRRPIDELPLVPLLDNGSPLIHFIGIDSLCLVIKDAIDSGGEGLRGRILQIHQTEPCTLRAVMESIRRQRNYLCWFVPVPSLPVLWALSLIERIPFLRLPITSTNIKGLRQSSNERFSSDFCRFGYPEEELDTLVQKAGGRPPAATAANPEGAGEQ